MDRANILYLFAYHPEQGLAHIRCRKLIEELKKHFDVTLRYRISTDTDFQKMDESWRIVSIPESEFLSGEYEMVLIEEKLIVSSLEESVKVRAATLKKFIDNGGIALFLFGEVNEALNNCEYNLFLANAGLPLLRRPHHEREFPDIHLAAEPFDRDLIFGNDHRHHLKPGHFFWIDVNREYLQYVDPQIHPAFDGISRIAVCYPVQVQFQKILLAGNPRTTRMLTSSDLWWDGDLYHIFGTFSDFGRGVGALVTGGICLDIVGQEFPTDANKFMANLLNLFLQHQRLRSPFLPFSKIAAQLRRKARKELALAQDDPEQIYFKFVEDFHRLVTEPLIEDRSSRGTLRLKQYDSKIVESVGVLDALQTSTLLCLRTGESLLDYLQPPLDFAPVGIEYSRAIENELNEWIFWPFKKWYLKQATQNTEPNEHSKNLHRLIHKGVDLTLGQMAILFQFLRSEKKTAEDKLLGEFRRFLFSFPNSDLITGEKGLQSLITCDNVDLFRNGSAHPGQYTMEKAQGAREWCYKILSLLVKLGDPPSSN